MKNIIYFLAIFFIFGSMLKKHKSEIDCISESYWSSCLETFLDANIYQTWAFACVRSAKNGVSHIIVKENNEAIAAAQVRIFSIPALKLKMAYVRWAPMWKRIDSKPDLHIFKQTLIALKNEYVTRQNMYLRVIPYETNDDPMGLRPIFEDCGFRWKRSSERTLLLPLIEPLDTIRTNLSKNWRKHLNRAEKMGMRIISGTEPELIDSIKQIYREMIIRKKLTPAIDFDELKKIQDRLPPNQKMEIMVSLYDDKPVSGLIGSAIGSIGIELVAATGNDGLELGGGYLLRWKMVEYLKHCGCLYYDLNSINPQKNPGGYQFKKGLSGKNGLDVEFLGIFDSWQNPLLRYAICLMDFPLFQKLLNKRR